jgi:hypothetical protein
LEEQNEVWKPRRKRKLSSLIEYAMKSRQILKSDSKIGGTDKVRGKYARQFGAIETHAQSTKFGPGSEDEETKHHEKRGREGRVVDETSVGSVDKFQGWGRAGEECGELERRWEAGDRDRKGTLEKNQ